MEALIPFVVIWGLGLIGMLIYSFLFFKLKLPEGDWLDPSSQEEIPILFMIWLGLPVFLVIIPFLLIFGLVYLYAKHRRTKVKDA